MSNGRQLPHVRTPSDDWRRKCRLQELYMGLLAGFVWSNMGGVRGLFELFKVAE